MSEQTQLVKLYTIYALELLDSAKNELDQLPEEEEQSIKLYKNTIEDLYETLREDESTNEFSYEHKELFEDGVAEQLRNVIQESVKEVID